MNVALLAQVAAKHQKKQAPELRSGEVARAHQKISAGGQERIQIFEGMVIRVRGGRGMDGTFTVRRVSGGIGIERVFPLHLPSITKVVKTKHVNIRQARPYYLRDLTSRQIKKSAKGELREFVAWEDTTAAEEAEKIKAEQEAEAKARDDAKAKEEAEAEAKVAAAQAAHAQADDAAARDDSKSDDAKPDDRADDQAKKSDK